MNELTNETTFKCHNCEGEGYKTDGQGRVWCKKCLRRATNPKPVVKLPTPGRNQQCTCGSGMKYKKCCLNTK